MLDALTADYAKEVYDLFLFLMRNKPYNRHDLPEREGRIFDINDKGVRCAPVSLARAAARLCQYPEKLLTAPPERVAQVVNALANVRMSIVRGVFRSSRPFDPQTFPLQFVPTNRDGAGLVN